MPSELEALIANLEAAPFGARGFDEDIWRAFGGKVVPVREVGGHEHLRWVDADGSRRRQETTHFTTDLRAAYSLIPKGAWFLMGAGRTSPSEPLYGCRITSPDDEALLGEGEHHHSLCLALCIAALRARSATP